MRALVLLATTAILMAMGVWQTRGPLPGPAVVLVPQADLAFRPAGDFRVGNRAVDAPLRHIPASPGFAIMKYPVSRNEYQRCVDAAACRVAETSGPDSDYAVTGVSFLDATAYAAWLSDATSQSWHLPSDQQWWQAAAERVRDQTFSSSSDDPAKRWLESYRTEAGAAGHPDPVRHPRGRFGDNSLGVADLGGNVWEWTASCQQNTSLDDEGKVIASSDYCGVRVIAGRHRTFLVDFIRDPQSGGCSVGLPPDYIGFRLVRD
ncbi:MAG: SUMF1/EgtB/PvdO family nonheme iron enzyme [bacterium]